MKMIKMGDPSRIVKQGYKGVCSNCGAEFEATRDGYEYFFGRTVDCSFCSMVGTVTIKSDTIMTLNE